MSEDLLKTPSNCSCGSWRAPGPRLRTAVAPTLREIGELAAIAAIRTALNYFISKEIKEEQAQLAGEQQTSSPSTARP